MMQSSSSSVTKMPVLFTQASISTKAKKSEVGTQAFAEKNMKNYSSISRLLWLHRRTAHISLKIMITKDVSCTTIRLNMAQRPLQRPPSLYGNPYRPTISRFLRNLLRRQSQRQKNYMTMSDRKSTRLNSSHQI